MIGKVSEIPYGGKEFGFPDQGCLGRPLFAPPCGILGGIFMEMVLGFLVMLGCLLFGVHHGGIGLAVERTRILLTAVAALLAASAVSVVGLLGFVGLIVPHAARLMIGADYRFLLPAAALLGIAVVTLSDTAARLLFAPLELPVGIIMAVVGAPFFLYLLRRQL